MEACFATQMDENTQRNLAEYDIKAIPPTDIRIALEGMPYATTERVMFRMLAITGCRIACLDKMRMRHLLGNYIYWETSKVSGKYRKEFLPDDYLAELREYRKNNRVDDNLFGISGETFTHRFNQYIRPTLGGLWMVKGRRPNASGFSEGYLLQIRNLRKTFQTYDFARNYAKWRDAGVALEMTSKRMKHSSTHITAHHYIENFDVLGIKTVTVELDPLKNIGNQMRILDFL